MSGGLFARAAAREIGRPLSSEEADALQQRHGELFIELLPERRPLPGAVELLAELDRRGMPFVALTNGSAYPASAQAPRLRALGLPIADDRLFTPNSVAAGLFRTRGPAKNGTGWVFGQIVY